MKSFLNHKKITKKKKKSKKYSARRISNPSRQKRTCSLSLWLQSFHPLTHHHPPPIYTPCCNALWWVLRACESYRKPLRPWQQPSRNYTPTTQNPSWNCTPTTQTPRATLKSSTPIELTPLLCCERPYLNFTPTYTLDLHTYLWIVLNFITNIPPNFSSTPRGTQTTLINVY